MVGAASCHVLYTSGSTGKPKGVELDHRNVMNHVDAYRRLHDFGSDCRSLFIVAFTFDMHIHNMYAAFPGGGALYAFPKHHLLENLNEIMSTHKINTIQCTPSALSLISIDHAASLTSALIAGEALPTGLMQKWVQHVPAFFNFYGPTETDAVTATLCTADMAYPFSIGKPLHNVHAYIVDPADPSILMPPGIPGELVVSGHQVGRGYRKQIERTAKAFIISPFAPSDDSPHARMYRTGDLCRWLPDGTIGYMGRIDQQVKLRGLRIELGEIENVLLQHESVEACAVSLVGGATGFLAAYVQLVQTETAAAADMEAEAINIHTELTAFAAKQLTKYMVPTSFTVLEQMPLTSSGKIDRKALPQPSTDSFGGSAGGADSVHVPPRTPLEVQLAALYQSVLGVDAAVGVTESFFDLGGSSLTAVRLVHVLRSDVSGGEGLGLTDVFEHPSVEAMAVLLSSTEPNEAAAVRPPLMPTTDAEHKALGLAPDLHPLSANQEQMLVLYSLDKQSSVYNMPMELTTPPGTVLDVQVVRRCLDALVMRHASLRTHIVDDVETKQAMQRVCPACDFDVPLEVMDDNDNGEDDAGNGGVRAFVSRVSEAVFDLYAGPWVRFGLAHDTSRDCSTLVIAMHHIAGDGWSLGFLPSELSVMYEAARDDASLSAHTLAHLPSLPELTVQYTDYAHWQRRWLSEVSEDQLEYWRDQLGANGGPAPLDLPTDRPRPKRQTFNGAYVYLSVPSDIVAQLRTLGNAHGASLYMTLLGAYQLLLSRYSRQEEVCVGSPYAGRDEAATQHIMGYMVNMLAMKCDMSGGEDVSFVDVLGRVRATVLGAFAHADVPFHHVVDGLQVSRDASRTPVYQAMFVLQAAPSDAAIVALLSGVSDAALLGSDADAHTGHTAQFDLQLSFDDTDPAGNDNMNGFLNYNTDLFDHDTAQRMARQYVQLLRSIVAEPSTPITNLVIASEEDLRMSTQLTTEQAAAKDFRCWFDCLPRTDDAALRSTDPKVQALTYNELARFVNDELRAMVPHFGIERTDRLCVVIPNGPEAAVALAFTLFCTYAPLNPNLQDHEFEFEFEDLPAKALVVMRGAGSDGAIKTAVRMQIPVIEMVPQGRVAGLFRLEWLHNNALLEPLPMARADWPARDDIALVLHTSGTTKKPKIVPLTHENIAVGSMCIRSTLELKPSDTCINIMPLFHIHGISINVIATLLAGGSVICTPGIQSVGASVFFEWLERLQPNWYSAVPTMHQLILRYGEEVVSRGDTITHNLELIRNCSAALLPAVSTRMQQLFGCSVLPTYAMTESDAHLQQSALWPSQAGGSGPSCGTVDQGAARPSRRLHRDGDRA